MSIPSVHYVPMYVWVHCGLVVLNKPWITEKVLTAVVNVFQAYRNKIPIEKKKVNSSAYIYRCAKQNSLIFATMWCSLTKSKIPWL